jgi:predicted outer membrane repeat protein
MNSTISGNYADDDGGGIYGNATVTNSIVYGNDARDTNYKQYAGTPTFSYSDVQDYSGGTGNIDSDPLFVDFQQASKENPTAAGDFHICNGVDDPHDDCTAQSPAIDTGTSTGAPSDDIDDGGSRPVDVPGVPAVGTTVYDMGADEYGTP